MHGTCNTTSDVDGLYFYVGTFRSMCAVSNLAVFCSSLIMCFPSMWLRYFLYDFEMVPVALFIVGITSVFTFHCHCIFVPRALYFRLLLLLLLLLLLHCLYDIQSMTGYCMLGI